jgi:hypothetical protein
LKGKYGMVRKKTKKKKKIKSKKIIPELCCGEKLREVAPLISLKKELQVL